MLVRIDDVRAASELRENRQRHWRCSGRSAACRPRSRRPRSRFAPEVVAEAPDVAQNERALYRARRRALQSELDVLQSQALQRRQELSRLATRLGQLERLACLALEEG